MRNAYLSTLYELAKDNNRIMALVADNGAIVYDKFRKDFPERFLNFGISEANMVGAAAGLASCGKIPFAYTIASFLTMRAFEQIRNDVCMQKMNVKLVGIGVGFVYSTLGPTHQCVEDVAIMRTMPGMTILSPADPMESGKVTAAAASIDGPVYIRLATGGSPKIYQKDYDFKVGRGVVLREGGDIAIIGTGGILEDILKAAAALAGKGVSARVINMHTIKPIDKEVVLKAARDTRAVLTVEEHSIYGGLGSAVSEIFADEGLSVRLKRMGLKDSFPKGYGSYEEMKEMNGLSKKDILREAIVLSKDKKTEMSHGSVA